MSPSSFRLAMFVAFAGCSAFGWWDYVSRSAPNPPGPNASLDELARRHLGIDDGTKRLRDQITPLPLNQPILVIGRSDDWTVSEVYFLISYLAWPRPVWSISMVEKGRHPLFEFPPPAKVDASALFLYGIPADPSQNAAPVGSRLSVVRLAGNPS